MSTEKISQIATAISAIIAAITLIFTGWHIVSDKKQEQLVEWQAVVVYSILKDYGPIKFADIRTKYLDTVQQFSEFDIPKEKLSDQSLKRILVLLREKNIIIEYAFGDYDVLKYLNRDCTEMNKYTKYIEQLSNFNTVRSKILLKVDSDNGKYTQPELYNCIKEEGIEYETFVTVLYDLRAEKLIEIDNNGKISKISNQ